MINKTKPFYYTTLQAALLLICALLISNPLLSGSANAAGLSVQPSFLKAEQAFQPSYHWQGEVLFMEWSIAQDYYLYKDRTKLELINSQTQEKQNIPLTFGTEAKLKVDPNFGDVEVFYHTLSASAVIPESLKNDLERFNTKRPDNKTAKSSLMAKYQGCSEKGLCYRPQKLKIELSSLDSTPVLNTPSSPLDSGSREKSTTDTSQLKISDVLNQKGNSKLLSAYLTQQSLQSILLLFFALGLGLAFTPCIFPMIPILSSIIVNQSTSHKSSVTAKKGFALSFAYVSGSALCYGIIGFLTASFGAKANLAIYFQHPAAIIFVALLFIVLAFSMFGFYEIQMPALFRERLSKVSQSQQGSGYVNSFIMGLIASLVVSPCVSAPLAAVLIYIASLGDTVTGTLALISMAYGMGIPLLVIGVSGGKFLPKAGAWMVAIKSTFGVLMIAMAIWLFGRLTDDSVDLMLWGSFLTLLAFQIFDFQGSSNVWIKAKQGIATLLFIYGACLFIGGIMGNSDVLKPLENMHGLQKNQSKTQDASTRKFTKVDTSKKLQEQFGLAKRMNKPVILDLYADWCTACISMDKQIFSKAEASELLNNYHWIKYDITNTSEEAFQFLETKGLFGPPAILFYQANGEELESARIIGDLDLEAFKAHLLQHKL